MKTKTAKATTTKKQPVAASKKIAVNNRTGEMAPVIDAPKATAKKAAAPKKAAPQKEAETVKVRFYAKGEFYFTKAAGEFLGDATHIKLTVNGKTVSLVPTKSAKDAHQLGQSHAAKVLRVKPVLAAAGLTPATQDLAATVEGGALQVRFQ